LASTEGKVPSRNYVT